MVALLITAAFQSQAGEDDKKGHMKVLTQFTNQLAGEKSPYLLQHQHNPVNWMPWGPAAFEKAKKENKPIFLSIGYSTCHWCHVMAHESFENEEIAAVMNEHFVNIKLDREERPDVDKVYMTFVQATTGSGGWPMSVFLTPDLKPFLGGTYFPPEDREGRPGFKSVLLQVAQSWKAEHEKIVEHGNKVAEQLAAYAASEPAGTALQASILKSGYEQFEKQFDKEWGGFGSAPKFPRPSSMSFLFRYSLRDSGDDGKKAREMALFTLRKMAEGGMHDHLGGGFHRYSVDTYWHVPHFEKMLYDQAQLALAYTEAFQLTGDGQWERITRDILDYVLRDMTGKNGGFYSAEDADSLEAHGSDKHAEGAFYVWKQKEIVELLGEKDAAIFNRFYGVKENGNARPNSDPMKELTGKNTLMQSGSVAALAKELGLPEAELKQSLSASRKTLYEARAKRPHPHLDDKILTAWNGLMISAFAKAGQTLGDARYLEAAQKSARFIKAELWKDGRLLRSYREGASDISAFAEDYAYLICGLLDLYETDFDPAWLSWAVQLQEKMDALFYDEAHGGYFSTEKDAPHILFRMKEDYDGAEPAPGSVATHNLIRLAQITSSPTLRDRADKTAKSVSSQLGQLPSAMPQMLCSLDALLAPSQQIVIAGKPGKDDTKALLKTINERFLPHKILLLADGGDGQKQLGEKLDFLKTVSMVEGKATAYVCENFVCKLPVTDPRELAKLLDAPAAK